MTTRLGHFCGVLKKQKCVFWKSRNAFILLHRNQSKHSLIV